MNNISFPPPMDNNTIQVFISDTECGDEYSLQVPDNIAVGQLKKMAIGHFLTPAEAVGRSASPASFNAFSMASIGSAFSQLSGRGGGNGSLGGSHGAAAEISDTHFRARLGDCDPQEYHLLHVDELRRPLRPVVPCRRKTYK